MIRTIIIKELDRPLAQARAIMFAIREGFRDLEILKTERNEQAWRFWVNIR